MEFKIEFEKIKHNRRIVGIHFTCSETNIVKQPKQIDVKPIAKTRKLSKLAKKAIDAENVFSKA